MFDKVLVAFGTAGGFSVLALMVELLSDDALRAVAEAPAGRVLAVAVPSLLTAAAAYLRSEHRGYGGGITTDVDAERT